MQHPVPKSLLVHIGDITVSYGLLEGTIQMLIGSLINEHQRVGQIITAELSFNGLLAILDSLYRERHGKDEDFDILMALTKRAAKLDEIRNQISHSKWGAGVTAETITRIKTTAKRKNGLRFSFTNLGEPELAKVAHDLRVLSNEILDFGIKLMQSGKAINNPSNKTWGTNLEPEGDQ